MLFLIVLLTIVVVAAFAVLRALWRRAHASHTDPLEWLDEFSASKYNPMERLLDNRDYRFLASQSGYRRSIGRRLRHQRVAIFQSYLSSMFVDFHRVLKAARYIIVCSPEDQSEFASSLWRTRVRFYTALCVVELRVLLHFVGAGQVDARRLLTALGRIEISTRRLMPQFEAA